MNIFSLRTMNFTAKQFQPWSLEDASGGSGHSSRPKDFNIVINQSISIPLLPRVSLSSTKKWRLCLFPRHKQLFHLSVSTTYCNQHARHNRGRRQERILRGQLTHPCALPKAPCLSGSRWYCSGLLFNI